MSYRTLWVCGSNSFAVSADSMCSQHLGSDAVSTVELDHWSSWDW